MWVKFLSDYDYKPKKNVILAYLAGQEYSVTHDCGEAAIAAGAAVEIPTPNRNDAKKAGRAEGLNGDKENGEKIKPDGVGQATKAARQDTQGDKAGSKTPNGERG